MKTFSALILSVALVGMTASAIAQPPGGRGGRGPGGPGGPGGHRGPDGGHDGASPVERLLEMDVNGDGELTADEVTDAHLKPMFDRADADQDGVATKDELTAMAERQPRHGGGRGPGSDFGAGGPPPRGEMRAGPRQPGPPPGGDMRGGPRQPGPPLGGDMRGGPRQPGPPPGDDMRGGPRPLGPPPMGKILPPFVQEHLGLTDMQRQAIAKLQAKVDARLAKILTEEQLRKLQQPPGGGPRGGARDGHREHASHGGREGHEDHEAQDKSRGQRPQMER